MTQTLDTRAPETERGTQGLTYTDLRGLDVQEADRLVESFVSELRRMTPEERIKASRYSMNRWEYWVYAARFPDEVPLVNGELEGIALSLE
jgi:hypothetical protein